MTLKTNQYQEVIAKMIVPLWRKYVDTIPLDYVCYRWGFYKMVISAVLLALTVVPTIRLLLQLTVWRSSHDIAPAVILIMLIVFNTSDIILHGMLLYGYNKRCERQLTAYYIYSRILLYFSPTVVIIYFFLRWNNFSNYISSPGDTEVCNLHLTTALSMLFSLSVQSFIMLKLKDEIMKIKYYKLVDQAVNNFNEETEEPCDEKDTEDDKMDDKKEEINDVKVNLC